MGYEAVASARSQRRNPSISGSSGLNNQCVVDGVNITNTGYGGVGVYTVYFGSLGSGVTTDFIKEIRATGLWVGIELEPEAGGAQLRA